MRRRGRVDANQAAVVAALRAHGWSVQSLADVGKGCPDLLVGAHGINLLLEIKDGAKPARQRLLTDDEATWHRDWRGDAWVVMSPEEAVATVETTLAQRGRLLELARLAKDELRWEHLTTAIHSVEEGRK